MRGISFTTLFTSEFTICSLFQLKKQSILPTLIEARINESAGFIFFFSMYIIANLLALGESEIFLSNTLSYKFLRIGEYANSFFTISVPTTSTFEAKTRDKV
jgi:hypothetical protein